MMAAHRSEPGVRLSDLLADCADVAAHCDRDVLGLSMDSRGTRKGDLFLACAGTRTHGLDYVDAAIGSGAIAVAWESAQPVHGCEIRRVDGREIPLLAVPGLGRRVGEIAERFYGLPSRQLFIVGITGTNGKTSCSQFLAQALSELGEGAGQAAPCGVIGTLGSGLFGRPEPGRHTTPDPVTLHRLLADMRDSGVANVAMEVSSHGLHQGRVDGIAFDIAVFTNLSRDHLDYHEDMNAYGEAKQRLFGMPGLKSAVINADDAYGRGLLESLPTGVKAVSYGLTQDAAAAAARLAGQADFVGAVQGGALQMRRDGFQLAVTSPWGEGMLNSPLLGRFNASNQLAVLAVLMLMDIPMADALEALSRTRTVPGRMERFAVQGGQTQIVVDYAHTPDALRHVLGAVREHCSGELWCVFGCGGERDRGKRPLMGAAAEALADRVVLTDDNPRHEDAERIIADILSGVEDPSSVRVERDRGSAIRSAFESAGPDDIVVVAGKGHETWQQVGDERLPFSDRDYAASLLPGKGR